MYFNYFSFIFSRLTDGDIPHENSGRLTANFVFRVLGGPPILPERFYFRTVHRRTNHPVAAPANKTKEVGSGVGTGDEETLLGSVP